MTGVTLKSLHAFLRLIENASELKRKMPSSSTQRTVKDGLYELGKLIGADHAAFKDPDNIAALIGPQRFVMMWGEPSVTDHVARVFDSSSVLLTVLTDPTHYEQSPSGQSGTTLGPAYQPLQPTREQQASLESLKPLLSGNVKLTCRLFRALFEHMLGFVSPSSAQQGNVLLVNELTGSRAHSRSFLSTALFLVGMEIDPDHLISFMMDQGLLGMHIFEHMLQNRDYCDAYYTFRRLERAFIGSPAEEEAQLRERIDKFNAQFEGKPYGEKVFGADEPEKPRVDAYLAAADLLEAMALTPWCMSLNKAISVGSSNCIQSMRTIARHFERFATGADSKEQANQAVANHLLAFARQFSTDSRSL